MHSPYFALTSAFSKARCNFLPSNFANIPSFFSFPFFSSPVAYLVSLTAWLLYIDKVFKVFFSFLSPVYLTVIGPVTQAPGTKCLWWLRHH